MADPPETATRYFARILEENTTAKPWESTVAQNITTIIVAYLALRFLTNIANKVIDHVLLHNFPDIALRWCIVQEDQSQKTSRLRRTQKSALRVLAAVTLLLRWPGWHILQMHLWQCIRLSVALFAGAQAALVGTLILLHAFIWTAESLAALTGWDPERGRRAAKRILESSTAGITLLLPATPPPKFSGPNMLRKAPNSVGMGRFLKDIRLEGKNMDVANTFIVKEYNSNLKKDETVVYHSITTQEKYWDFSFEELKLQHYEDTGRFKCPPPQDKVSRSEGTLSASSVDKILPSWLSSRTFHESAFSCSTSSQRSSEDSVVKLKASSTSSFGAGGKTDSPSVLPTTPLSFVGDDMVRRFT